MVLPSNPVHSESLSSKHTVSDNHLLIGPVQVHPVHLLGPDVCKVHPVLPVVKVKAHHIVKALGHTPVVLAVRGQFPDVVLVGEYQPGGDI